VTRDGETNSLIREVFTSKIENPVPFRIFKNHLLYNGT
jgi:hypothetical protein